MMTNILGETEAYAILIYDGAPVYRVKKYDTKMNTQQKHDFICDFLDAEPELSLISHQFRDNLEMYYLQRNRNRHFMEYVLTALDYSNEYEDCDKVTSPVVFLTKDIDIAKRIIKMSIDTHNKISDAILKKYKSSM